MLCKKADVYFMPDGHGVDQRAVHVENDPTDAPDHPYVPIMTRARKSSSAEEMVRCASP